MCNRFQSFFCGIFCYFLSGNTGGTFYDSACNTKVCFNKALNTTTYH